MESRFLDRIPLKPEGPGQQTLHPIVTASYNNEGLYSQARYHTDLVITYHPTIGLATPGQVMFGVSRESSSATPSSIAAMSPQSTTAVWRRATIVVKKTYLNTQKWLRLDDPCAYFVYWWSTPSPPGYFTFTATIKSVNPYMSLLPITPEPVEWPVASLRGQIGPALYKVGFWLCQARAAGGNYLLSTGALAIACGGIPGHSSLGVISSEAFTNPNNAASANFEKIYPGAKVLMVAYAFDKILYQSKAGIDGGYTDYASRNGGVFKGITVTIPSKEQVYRVLPRPMVGWINENNNDVIMMWSLFDYTELTLWQDWKDPCPTSILVCYYAIPPSIDVIKDPDTQFPCVRYGSGETMLGPPITVPAQLVPQAGVYSSLALYE